MSNVTGVTASRRHRRSTVNLSRRGSIVSQGAWRSDAGASSLADSQLSGASSVRRRSVLASQKEDERLAAGHWISSADALLVCAGGGLSRAPGRSVFAAPADFRRHYPFMARYGYTSGAQARGVVSDESLCAEVKWGFFGRLAGDLARGFPPHPGHAALRRLVGSKEHFVLNTAADSALLRGGFDAGRVYAPHGSWGRYQCARPCMRSAVWDAAPLLRGRDDGDVSPRSGALPAGGAPRCPDCGGEVVPNVRLGDWFLHDPEDAAQERLVEWVERRRAAGARVTVLEVGMGYRDPAAGRWPAEAIARELPGCALVRVNPLNPEVPGDLPMAVGLPAGWEVLEALLPPPPATDAVAGAAAEAERVRRQQAAARVERRLKEDQEAEGGSEEWHAVRRRVGHFDWRIFLHQLRGVHPSGAPADAADERGEEEERKGGEEKSAEERRD